MKYKSSYAVISILNVIIPLHVMHAHWESFSVFFVQVVLEPKIVFIAILPLLHQKPFDRLDSPIHLQHQRDDSAGERGRSIMLDN